MADLGCPGLGKLNDLASLPPGVSHSPEGYSFFHGDEVPQKRRQAHLASSFLVSVMPHPTGQ